MCTSADHECIFTAISLPLHLAGNDRVVCVLSEDDYFSNTASDDSDPAPSLESKDILENGALPLRVDDSDAPNTAAGSEAEMITSEASALDGDSTRVADGNRALSSVEETSISKPASGRDAYRKQLLAGLQGSNGKSLPSHSRQYFNQQNRAFLAS